MHTYFLNFSDETRNLTFIFPSPEQRMTWEVAFSETKEKLGNFKFVSKILLLNIEKFIYGGFILTAKYLEKHGLRH